MEQEYIILQIQEDDYGCEERSAGAKKTVLVRLKDAKGNERLTRQEDDWLYEQGIDSRKTGKRANTFLSIINNALLAKGHYSLN